MIDNNSNNNPAQEVIKEPLEITECKEPLSNKYSTRKKIIDFAKIGEKLSLTGSNCHYCKSIMCVQDSNACRNNEKNILSKKKTCNKKFCYDCLQKIFPSFWGSRSSKDWRCPCCLNECPCSQCKKVWIKLKNWKEKSDYEDSRNKKRHSGVESMDVEEEEEEGSKSSIREKDEIDGVDRDKGHNWTNKLFDLNSIHSILQNSKINTDKLCPISRPKIEIIPESLFFNLKTAKEEYYETLNKYKERLLLDQKIIE